MALDLTNLGTQHNNAVTAKAGPLVKPLAGILVNSDQLIHQVGEEDFKQRVRVATAAMRGDTAQLTNALFGHLGAPERETISKLHSGEETSASLRQQQPAQAQLPAAQPQQQPQVVQSGVVTPSQELTDAVTQTATAAAKTATEADAAKGTLQALEEAISDLPFFAKKEVQKAFTALKGKVEATATAAANTKTAAEEAKTRVGQLGSGAPATQAMPVTSTP